MHWKNPPSYAANPPSYQSQSQPTISTESTLSPTLGSTEVDGYSEAYSERPSAHRWVEDQQDQLDHNVDRDHEQESLLFPTSWKRRPYSISRLYRFFSALKAHHYDRIHFSLLLFILLLLISWIWESHVNTDRPSVRERIRADWAKEALEHKEEQWNRAGMFWSAMEAGKCEGYNSRSYQSTLHVPLDFKGDVIKACMQTSVQMHGMKVRPLRCENLGLDGVRGHFEVLDEPKCKPWWSQYKDKGCTAPGSGLREIEQHLDNLNPSDATDWRIVCMGTPTSFQGQTFNGPDGCANWGSDAKPNLFGYWRVPDEKCR